MTAFHGWVHALLLRILFVIIIRTANLALRRGKLQKQARGNQQHAAENNTAASEMPRGEFRG
jgi:hypothetical protein